MQTKSKEKYAKEKNTVTIHKILHKILDAIKIFYEICKVLKAILNFFLMVLQKKQMPASAFCCNQFFTLV